MGNKIKQIIKNITPLLILRVFKKQPQYGFFGKYQSWKEAQANSSGYDNPYVLEKVRNALTKVKNGEVAYERDSVVFNQIEYSWPVLASLLWIASLNENHLNIIDFEGSLGSSYFQNVNFFSHLKELKWNIVEQENFVECGKKYFQNNHISFFKSINECVKKSQPHAILLSSVIEYVEKPYDILRTMIEHKIPYIIIDRTSFLKNIESEEVITVQKVSPRIYDASYPCWIMSEKKVKQFLESGGYHLVADFDSPDKIYSDKTDVKFRGFIFKLQ
ncbi:MAG: methyltransferase, TIGR04325 family [Parcubacteria group bacterium]|nr:methyltransferase, TIGR04325 family [Parcubacteria group bacterium]